MNTELQKPAEMSHRFASVSLNSPISTFSSCDWHPADPTHWNARCVCSMPLRTSIGQRISMWCNSKWRTLPAPVFFTVDLLMGERLRPGNSRSQHRTLASQGNRAIVHQVPGNTQLKLAVNFPVMNFSSSDDPVILSLPYTSGFIHLWGFLATDLTVKASGCSRKWC